MGDSATTFDAGTEQFLTPDAGMTIDLPPYAWDERIIWSFNRGLAGRGLNSQDAINFLTTILPPTAQLQFSAGFAVGAALGAKQALNDYVRFVANTLHLFAAAAQQAKVVFDGELIAASIAEYLSAPGSAQAATILENIAQQFDKDYPDLAAALRNAKLAGMILDSVVSWLSVPDNAAQVAVLVAGVLGQAVAALFDGLRPYLNDAMKLGRGAGYLVGQLFMWIIFDLIGLPFSVALDLFETVVLTGTLK